MSALEANYPYPVTYNSTFHTNSTVYNPGRYTKGLHEMIISRQNNYFLNYTNNLQPTGYEAQLARMQIFRSNVCGGIVSAFGQNCPGQNFCVGTGECPGNCL